MRQPLGVKRCHLLTVAIALGASLRGGTAVEAWAGGGNGDPRRLPGWPLYDRLCLACHGTSGDGKGPAAPYTWGDPRAFSLGDYKWRSTPIGQPPTDDDLRTAIRHGAPGTSMPGFGATLSNLAIDQMLDVVKAFAPDTFAAAGKPIVLAAPPRQDRARGAQLWIKWCGACHGTGKDDGPSAFALKQRPYPLAFLPLRRPRARDDHESRRLAAATSIATGLAGTPMPSFSGSLPDADIWAVADHVTEINARARRSDRSALDAGPVERDRDAPILVGTWPGSGDAAEVPLFSAPIPPQGLPPASLAPAQASLHSEQCGRCHAKQFREWQPSIHGAAASPGLLAQIDFGMSAPEVSSCQRCHAPLAEQRDDRQLRAEGLSCAGCHVRNWQRHGPPNVSPTLLSLPGYPLTTLSIFERADFCMSCHQLPPRDGVNGKPLLNTYKEWLESPYMARGIQCQHCHMPNREHSVLGVHDLATFRQGIALTASAHRTGSSVTATAELTNVGAGHYLPTTPTPAVWLTIELVDARGRAIEGASSKLRIGRDIYHDGTWHERADTRIPPGERAVMSRAWSGGRTPAARAARITVEVHPDAFYERFYAQKLAGTLAPQQRVLYAEALARGAASHYVAETRDISIAEAR